MAIEKTVYNKITQAVILSAGLGTRLKPFTDHAPKVMVSLLGRPILQYHLERFKKYGVEEFFINLHYLPEKITDYFGDGSSRGVKITYNYEKNILGTAGGFKTFAEQLSDNFFVIYGDVFNLVDYSVMEQFFREKNGALGVEVIGPTDHPYDSDLVTVDDQLRFIKIHPKPHVVLPAHYKAMRGIFIFNHKIFNYVPTGRYYELDRDLLPDTLKHGEKIYGYECNAYIKDIGTVERYQKAEDYLARNKLII